jgi:putative Holliday junction resolvase
MPRLLAVDPGEVHIGLAISDPGEVIARPLDEIRHHSRSADADAILAVAREHQAERILVGIPMTEHGSDNPQARKSQRLIAALQERSTIPVEPWDESGSSAAARGLPPGRASEHSRAAAIFLQEYLDAPRR